MVRSPRVPAVMADVDAGNLRIYFAAQAYNSLHHRPASRASVAESYTVLPPFRTRDAAMNVSTKHYDNSKINVLRAALDLACKELCIRRTDQENRRRVASMMIAFAKHGHIDVEKLKTFAVQQF